MKLFLLEIFLFQVCSCLITTHVPITTVISTTASTATTTTPKPLPLFVNRTIKAGSSITFECNLYDTSVSTIVELRRERSTVLTINVTDNKFEVQNKRFSVAGAVSGHKKLLSIEMLNTSLSDHGVYQCYVKTGQERVVLDNKFNVTVLDRPRLKLKPDINSISLYNIDSLVIVCSATGYPIPTVQWSLYDVPVKQTNKNQQATLEINGFSVVKDYTYICHATNDLGNDSMSVKVNVLESKPSRAKVFKVCERKERSLQLCWVPNINHGKSNLTSYILNGITLSSLDTTYIYMNLQPYRTYTYVLQSCNNEGCSESVILHVTTLEQAKPSEPTNLTIFNATPYCFGVAFNHGQHLSGQKMSYTKICYYSKPQNKICSKVNVTDTSVSFTHLHPFTLYTITGETCVLKSVETCSEVSQITHQTDIAVSSRVTNLQIVNTVGDAIVLNVTWNAPHSLNSAYVEYIIYYKTFDDSIGRTKNTDFKTNSTTSANARRYRRSPKELYVYMLTNLQGDTNYSVQVNTRNDAGTSYGLATSVTTDETVPMPPKNLIVQSAEDNRLFIAWTAPMSLPIVKTYKVVYYETGINKRSLYVTNIKATIPSLEQNTAYIVEVTAVIIRKRDSKQLYSFPTRETFTTKAFIPAVKSDNNVLVAVTVVTLLLVVIVVLAASFYCRRYGWCAVKYTSKFYISNNDVGFPFSVRQSLKKIEIKRVPMTLDEFNDHVIDLHSNSDYLFSEEYLSLGPNRPDRIVIHSNATFNVDKNRYRDIVAYDQTRVRLMSLTGVPGSNYINANYIDGYHKNCAYVATQAPLHHTIPDFWRMVWESESHIIVMLTNLMEKGRRKCDMYWPEEGTIEYRGFLVALNSTKYYSSYIIREFSLTKLSQRLPTGNLTSPGETRTIWQYHYTEWPDFGAPRDRTSVLTFIFKTREHEKEYPEPPIVHCSAGVGRTGTYIVIDSQMRRFDHRQDIEIYNFLKKIRQQRNYLVQQEVQYIFVHDALLDYMKCGDTRIPLIDLEMTLNQDYWTVADNTSSKLTQEWKVLNEIIIPMHLQSSGHRPCNRPKNRHSAVVPVDASRVHLLMKLGMEGSDYINASCINSFNKRRAFIVTQSPLQQTLEDFWRLNWEFNTNIIINLLTLEEMDRDEYTPYMPSKLNDSLSVGRFQTGIVEENPKNNYVRRVLKVTRKDSSNSKDERKIYHYHFYNWAEDFFPRMTFLFELLKDVLDCQKNLSQLETLHRSSPIVIHCKHGMGRSGLLCALFNLQEQLQDYSKIVDVYSTVKSLRCQRPCMIQTEEQYDYLYKALVSLKHSLSKTTQETGAVGNDVQSVNEAS